MEPKFSIQVSLPQEKVQNAISNALNEFFDGYQIEEAICEALFDVFDAAFFAEWIDANYDEVVKYVMEHCRDDIMNVLGKALSDRLSDVDMSHSISEAMKNKK